MDCATCVLSQPGAHRALSHAAVEIKGDTEVQGNAPQTNLDRMPPVTHSSKAANKHFTVL